MAKLTAYAAVTALNESMLFYTAIDTNADTVFESKKLTLATLRGGLFATEGTIFKESKGADVASANALALGLDGNYFDITGTTDITSIDTIQIGTEVLLQFDGVLTLTHHATNLILPSEDDITTGAGDHARFREYDTGLWRCVSFTKADAAPIFADATKIHGLYVAASPQTLVGAGAVNITTPVTNVETTGAGDALTLVDAEDEGHMKVINHDVDGGSYVLTPTTFAAGSTITVTTTGSITLMWTNSGWQIVSQTGVAVIA